MARFLKTRTKVLGLHPGSLVYIGDSGSTQKININLINYNKDTFLESHSASFEKCIESVKNTDHITWIEFQGLSDKKIIEEIGNQFGIHRLWLEDILNTDHRAKIEEMDNMLFFINKHIHVTKKQNSIHIQSAQTSILFSKNFVISFHDNKKDIFAPIKNRLRKSIWKIRESQTDYLFYSLIDLLIDQYYVALESIGDYFEELESRVTTDIDKFNPIDILNLKGDFLYLRKTVFPIKEGLNKIIVSNHPWIAKHNLHYFQDIQDHTIQIIEIIDYYNELTTFLMDFYQNTLNRKTNEIIQILTIFTAIFIPLTFIVGIYGMNFKFIPELHWKYGYLIIWLIILLIGGGMIYMFKKKKWF